MAIYNTYSNDPTDDLTLDRVLRLKQVLPLVGVSRATFYTMIKDGRFPQPIQIGAQATGWKASQVRDWLNGLKPRARADAAEVSAQAA